MKNKAVKLLFAICFSALALPSCAQDKTPEAKTAAPADKAAAPAQAVSSDTPTDAKILYSLGYLLGENLKDNLVLEKEDDFKAVSQGMRDSLLSRSSQTDLETYKPLIIKRYQEDTKKRVAARKTEQNNFLEQVKKGRNIKVLPNGAVVQTIKKGKGKKPEASDTVKVHYEGALTNGVVFDSSLKRGQPAQFPLANVIPCWTQGLQEMNVGSKAKLYCPPQTAYGDTQSGPIPPSSLLVFDVELLDIVK